MFIDPLRAERPNWNGAAVSYAVSIQGFMGGVAPYYIGSVLAQVCLGVASARIAHFRTLSQRGVAFWGMVGAVIMTVGFELAGAAIIWVRFALSF